MKLRTPALVLNIENKASLAVAIFSEDLLKTKKIKSDTFFKSKSKSLRRNPRGTRQKRKISWLNTKDQVDRCFTALVINHLTLLLQRSKKKTINIDKLIGFIKLIKHHFFFRCFCFLSSSSYSVFELASVITPAEVLKRWRSSLI